MSFVTPDRFVSLKQAVKNECNRRKYVGSVQSYAGQSYDYSVNPAADIIIKEEHYSKINTPLRAINPAGLPNVAPGRIISDTELTTMEVQTHTFASRSITTTSTSDCASSCTGTCTTSCQTGCYSRCAGGCSGCSGRCSGSCSSCTGGCSGSCSGGCGTGCAAGCTTSCYAGCTTGCGALCGTCGTNCSGVCGANCSGTNNH